ncbi:MAG: glutathione S-transferase [Roseiarcus sp.]|jgi:glutathione S-transferase
MIVVHHLDHSRSQRALWLLEELGLEYEIRRYARDPKTMLAPASLMAAHPLGKSPVIVDGDKTLAESGAILEYLIEAYGAGRFAPPPGSQDRLRYTYFMHYAEGSLMPPLTMKYMFMQLPRRAPFLARPIAGAIASKALASYVDPQIKRHLDFLEGELARRPWFAGDAFSAADIQMSYPLEAAASRAGLDARRPKLWDFLRRIRERPAYARAAAKGDPTAL